MISSSSNPQIKEIIKLNKSARERKKKDCFVVEGLRMFSEVPEDQLVRVYATEQFYKEHRRMFDGRDYELVAENVFKGMSDTMTPQGVLCIVRQAHWRPEDILGMKNPLIIVLESLQDPGNLGTILRTAEGAGVTGILMSCDTVDIYNSKAVRATMGSVFRVPFAYVEKLPELALHMRELGICSFAGHLKGTDIYAEDYSGATAFFIGNEGGGLSEELTDAACRRVKIPMLGKVESLNAATAATVLMYEALRQRKKEKA